MAASLFEVIENGIGNPTGKTDSTVENSRLEVRDRYFTKLKRQIEDFYHDIREKVSFKKQSFDGCLILIAFSSRSQSVVIAHSMGSKVFLYFLQWVESSFTPPPGARSWTDKYIEAFVNVGGALLGTPSSVSRLLAGEVTDLQGLGLLGSLIDLHFSVPARRDLMR